jgi:hypothetical protein
LRAFLYNRQQYVVIENCFSGVADVISGVPQGSVLGPVLFLIFINDIDSVCCGNTVSQLFADDLKLYSSVTVTNSSLSLQQSIDKLVEWSVKWQLAINIGKCAVLTVGSRHGRIASNYFINNVKLLNADSVVDLGILTDNVLSYHAHIHNIVVKATQRVGVL